MSVKNEVLFSESKLGRKLGYFYVDEDVEDTLFFSSFLEVVRNLIFEVLPDLYNLQNFECGYPGYIRYELQFVNYVVLSSKNERFFIASETSLLHKTKLNTYIRKSRYVSNVLKVDISMPED